MPLRKGPPPQDEIHRAHHLLAMGANLEALAAELGRSPQTLRRYLDRYQPEVHPQAVNGSIKVTLASGARIEGLSLQELVRLARAL